MKTIIRAVSFVWLITLVVALALPAGADSTFAQDPSSVITIPYAAYPDSDPNLTALDIYPVAGATNYPVVIYVHGGGWATGDKGRVRSMPPFFHEAGYLLVSVNYRLTPDVEFPTHVEDVAAAIAWVHGHIADYGGDPAQLFLMGHSAGAHLVALVATDSRYLAAHDLPLTTIKAVAPLDTQAHDINLYSESYGGRLGEVYTATFGTDPEGWRFASPMTYVAADMDIPPMVVVYSYGTDLNAENADQDRAEINRVFVEALQTAGIDAVLVPSLNQSHGDIIRDFGTDGDRVSMQVLDFFEQYRSVE